MPVIRNYKICDNAEACNAIRVCPTGAFRWNEEKKTLEVDEETCIGCGLCATSEDSCSVGAIKYAKTEEEAEKIRKEIEDDPRTVADLMVDRYGSQPINMPFSCSEERLEAVLTTERICLVEINKEDLEECLIKSIPVKEILSNIENSTYRKIEIQTENLVQKYNIEQLPAMLIFKDEKLLGKIEGYYTVDQKQEFLDKINEIVKKQET